MSAAMEDLGYEGQSEIDCPQEWVIPGTDQIWKDWTVDEGVGAQGLLTLHNALVASCNTVFYQLGYQLDEKDNELLPEMAKAYGLGQATGIPYLPEIAGVVPDPVWKQEVMGDFWATGDAVNLAIGQGYFEATPLQMATAYAAIANGGHLLMPYVVEYTKDGDDNKTRVGKRTVQHDLPVSRAHIEEIQSAMRDQTSNTWGAGSARVFGDYGWPIAGKTGTAQNELNQAAKPHAWFAAFGPYGEKATVTSIVMVESVGEGVVFAAPITRQIYDAYLQTDLPQANSG
jgi:penicillin-binding protein 2